MTQAAQNHTVGALVSRGGIVHVLAVNHPLSQPAAGLHSCIVSKLSPLTTPGEAQQLNHADV